MPLVRGTYAIASVDRKTVLKVMVLDRSESGFDPEEYAESVDGLTADPELIARLRGMWTMTQLRVESYDPLVLPAMFFLLRVTQRLASLSDGVIADPLSERYLLPKQALHRPVGPDLPFFPTDVVKLSFEVSEDGYVGGTLGLKKFDLPEVQIPGLKESSQDLSRHFLGNLTQYILRGNLLSPGDTAGDENLPFRVVKDTSASRDGTTDVIYKLVPPPNTTPEDVIDAWDRAADLEEAEP